jgi:hypothetical protein
MIRCGVGLLPVPWIKPVVHRIAATARATAPSTARMKPLNGKWLNPRVFCMTTSSRDRSFSV